MKTLLVIDGNSTVKYEDGILTASRTGDAVVIFRAKFSIKGSDKLVSVYSQPVTITVK